MPLKNIFGGNEESSIEKLEPDEYVELEPGNETKNRKVRIKVVTLHEFKDAEQVQKMLRNGDIVWVKIAPLKQKDMTDLKRAIERIKKTVRSIDGDVAGIDEEWLVATPHYAHVHR